MERGVLRPISTGLLAIAALAGGCASKPAAVRERPRTADAVQPPPPVAASALAFTPPVARDQPEYDLDRSGRGVYALAGYEENVVTQTYTWQDDHQRFGYNQNDFSTFERRSISTTITVRR